MALDVRHKGDSERARFVVDFQKAGALDVGVLGGKCAGLVALIASGAPVPAGFAVTTDAYATAVSSSGLDRTIARRLTNLDVNNVTAVRLAAEEIRKAIVQTSVPAEIVDEIEAAYERLAEAHKKYVAVRSSGNEEDLADASFAGQGDTFLWVHGAHTVIDKVRACWASLYNERAITYRARHRRDDVGPTMAVAVQEMVDARVAGVALTLDPSNGDRSKIVIESIWGLGEPLVSGEITPDHFLLDKVTLEPIKRVVATKVFELVGDPSLGGVTRAAVKSERRTIPSLSDRELIAVAKLAKATERHFGSPQDIEWAISRDGGDNEILLLQSRPETVWSGRVREEEAKPYADGVLGVVDRLLAPLHASTKERGTKR